MRGFGINLLVWSGEVGPDERALLPVIRDLGYGCVETPVFAPESFDTTATARAIRDAGLSCTVSTALPAGAGLLDPDTAPAGIDFLSRVVTCAAGMGAEVVCGPLALPVGLLRGRGHTAAEWANAVAALRTVGDVAARARVTLALEPLNRFETYFVNTASDAVRLLDDVDHPAVGLLLDTFHMQIEEKSTPAALAQAARHLRHVHVSENDRGIVGSGQVPWVAVWRTLREIDYRGWVTVESFNAFIPALSGATCIWRPLALDPLTLARESIAFLNQLNRDEP